MTKNIQIATIRDKYEHIIKVDRTFGSDEIILVFIEADRSEESEYKEKIEQNIRKIQNYSDLVKNNFKATESINIRAKKTFCEIISECIDIILKHYDNGDKMIITLTEGSFLLNGALHYAATIVKSFYEIDLIINMTEDIGDETISHIQDRLITSSIWAIISTKDKPLIIDCLELNMNVEEMAVVLDVSPGTISNWVHLLQENKILEISKRDRALTNLGKLVSKITERERTFILANKFSPIISEFLEQGMNPNQIAKKLGLPANKLSKWIENFPDKDTFESIHRNLNPDDKRRMVRFLLEIKKENKGNH